MTVVNECVCICESPSWQSREPLRQWLALNANGLKLRWPSYNSSASSTLMKLWFEDRSAYICYHIQVGRLLSPAFLYTICAIAQSYMNYLFSLNLFLFVLGITKFHSFKGYLSGYQTKIHYFTRYKKNMLFWYYICVSFIVKLCLVLFFLLWSYNLFLLLTWMKKKYRHKHEFL